MDGVVTDAGFFGEPVAGFLFFDEDFFDAVEFFWHGIKNS